MKTVPTWRCPARTSASPSTRRCTATSQTSLPRPRVTTASVVAPLSSASNPGVIDGFIPRRELRPFVDQIWRYDGLVQEHDLERVLPTGTMQIIINLADDTSRKYDRDDPRRVETHHGAIVSGPHAGYFIIDTAEQVSVLGISFTPGGAGPFLGMHPAVAYALTQFSGVPHTRSISDVTDRVGLSPRRFIELFDAEVGLTPKLFCRIKRFQHATRIVHQAEVIDWADLAAMAGYYDQSHMIRDFQEFSGLNPSAYLKQRGPHLNHVPLPA